MLKKLAVGLLIILLIFAVLPLTAIDFLGRFALGYMIMDLVNDFIIKD
jgi:hypothetical protein